MNDDPIPVSVSNQQSLFFNTHIMSEGQQNRRNEADGRGELLVYNK